MCNSICRYGAVEARWPHKPKVGGSKPSPGNIQNFLNIKFNLFSHSNFILHHKHEVGGSKPSSSYGL